MPTAGTEAPLAMRRNGRNVRKAVRVEVSTTCTAARAAKPRPSRMPQDVAGGPAGRAGAADAGADG